MKTHISAIKFRLIWLAPMACLVSFTLPDRLTWTKSDKTEIEQVTKKISAFYKDKTSFSVSVTHQTFKGHFTPTAHDKSQGYMKRKGDNFHSFMLGIHSYQDDVVSFVVDTTARTVVVSDKKSFVPDESITLNNLNAQAHAVAYKKAATSDSGVYRVDYDKNFQVEATELHVNNDFSLREIVIFFAQEYPVNEGGVEKKVKAKAKISYGQYNFKPVFSNTEFSHKSYFIIQNKKLVATPAYKKYKLIDNRLNKNQSND